MEDQKVDTSDHVETTSDKTANQSVRAGGQAKGGVAAQPGDPSNPKVASARSAAADAKINRRN